LTTYETVLSTIIGSLRAALQPYTQLKRVLNTNVFVKAINEEIIMPLDTENLTGIMAILQMKYRKKNFGTFVQHALKFSAWKQSDQMTAWDSFAQVQSIKSDWAKRKLFTQMTEDNYFAMGYLNGLKPSKLKTDLISKTQEFIYKRQEEGSIIDETNTVMSFLERQLELARETAEFGESEGGSQKQRADIHNRPQHWKQNTTQKGLTAIEDAAVTDAAAAVTDQKYSGEVAKNKGATFTFNGRTLPYVAMLTKQAICAKCFSNGSDSPCSPKCFGAECNKCGYYGHKQVQCKQTHHKSGVKLN
jgi:hypothetical protein